MHMLQYSGHRRARFRALVESWAVDACPINAAPFAISRILGAPRSVLGILLSGAPRYDGWFVVPGRLEHGKVVDVLKGTPGVDWEKPEYIIRTFKNHRWHAFYEYLYFQGDESTVRAYADYLCRVWDTGREAEQRLVRLEVVFMQEINTLDNPSPAPDRYSLGAFDCGCLQDEHVGCAGAGEPDRCTSPPDATLPCN